MDYQHYLNQIKRLNEEINALNNAYIKIGGYDAKNRDTLHLFSMMNKKKERRSKLFEEFCNYETMKILKRTHLKEIN
jgi:hypothetical protein